MKKIQARIFKITAVLALISPSFLHPSAFAAPVISDSSIELPQADMSPGTLAAALAKADSLFRAKQYTQSLEIYQTLFQAKQYSPSMLLKLAYIEEGLGHVAQSTYYLNLYYLNTYDDLALNKLQDVAAKNRLEGYSDTDAVVLLTLMKQYYNPIALALAAICIFLLALMAFQKFKRNIRPTVPATLLLFFLGLLFGHTWFNTHAVQGIISSQSTYLMEGPSAGSSVISIVGEGHRVMILGKTDVWLKVKWGGREVYVKDGAVMRI